MQTNSNSTTLITSSLYFNSGLATAQFQVPSRARLVAIDFAGNMDTAGSATLTANVANTSDTTNQLSSSNRFAFFTMVGALNSPQYFSKYVILPVPSSELGLLYANILQGSTGYSVWITAFFLV